MELTESCAMTPAASVSGIYLGHPVGALLQRRAHRARPGRGLRRAQGRAARRGRALAPSEPRIRPRLTGARPEVRGRHVPFGHLSHRRRRVLASCRVPPRGADVITTLDGGDAGRPGLLRRNRPFSLLFIATAGSATGTYLAAIALSWDILERTELGQVGCGTARRRLSPDGHHRPDARPACRSSLASQAHDRLRPGAGGDVRSAAVRRQAGGDRRACGCRRDRDRVLSPCRLGRDAEPGQGGGARERDLAARDDGERRLDDRPGGRRCAACRSPAPRSPTGSTR